MLSTIFHVAETLIHTQEPGEGRNGNKAEEFIHSSAADYFYGKQVGKVKVALLKPVQTTYR